MKVKMKNCGPCLKGKLGGLVYYGNKNTNNTYARRYVKPKYTEVNKKLGLATKHLCAMNVPDEFTNELKRYVMLYNANIPEDEKPIRSSHNVFIKLMRSSQGIGYRHSGLELGDGRKSRFALQKCEKCH